MGESLASHMFSQKEYASLLLVAQDQGDPVTPANCKEYEEHEGVDGISSESSLLAFNITHYHQKLFLLCSKQLYTVANGIFTKPLYQIYCYLLIKKETRNKEAC